MIHQAIDEHRLHAAGWQSGWLRLPSSDRPSRETFVVKLGGSLLGLPDWPARVAGLLAAIDRPVTIVVGGGEVVEGLRRLDAVCPQPAERMHRLAITAMDVTARLVAETLGLPLLDPPGSTCEASAVVLVRSWLEAGLLDELPPSWHVTSDAIAALIARHSRKPLFLAKSAAPPNREPRSVALHDAASSGWIDPAFPEVAAGLSAVAWAAALVRPA
jgi:aspartokinase-like uncharacterized kinase